MKIPTINCQCFRDGKCLHQAAPRAWFGPATCILTDQRDPRVQACALQVPKPRPQPHVLQQPTPEGRRR